jgi:malonyl-CoA O-methyltransferase
MPVLDAAEAYPLWASTYDRETAVSLLEDGLVEQLTPPLDRARLLDVGCGTGRRIMAARAAVATGVEPCREMIAAAAPGGLTRPGLTLVEGHAGALPVADGAFDVVWCRLVLGHVAELARPYAEMARAAARGGTVIVSDFHPRAQAAGHRRTFRAAAGLFEIENHPHALNDHVAAAEAAGLTLVERREAPVGLAIRHLFAEAGRLDAYREQRGLPLVFALRFARP